MEQAYRMGHLSGNGEFTRKCQAWLENNIGCRKALFTHSCTAALEIAALLADLKPGDEVIMPSYTFVSTANAFVLRGAVPVFVDIREDTLNIDETRIASAITDKTRVIVPVHYGGVGCAMDAIMEIAKKNNLTVIEDAAQGTMSSYKNHPLGGIGHMAALSFHETKNIISGEGGALLLNDPRYIDRAEIIREKGTNRALFFQRIVDKYTWVDVGSSYLPSDLIAAFLWAQLEKAETITKQRLAMWDTYHEGFEEAEKQGLCRRPVVPEECLHNAHMYYLLLPNDESRAEMLAYLVEKGINAVFHYVPLHSSPAGLKYGRTSGSLSTTEDVSRRLFRLPLWIGLEKQINYIIDEIRYFLLNRLTSVRNA